MDENEENEYRKENYGHIEGEINIRDENPFDALRKDAELGEDNKDQDKVEKNEDK